ARLYEQELRDAPRAQAAFERLAAEGGDALADLARLYERGHDWRRLVELLPRLAERTEDRAARAPLWQRAGAAAGGELRDDGAAEALLVKALECDPEHGPAMVELARLYERRGDWLRAARLLVEAADRTSHRLDKTQLLFDAACLQQERLADQARAQ